MQIMHVDIDTTSLPTPPCHDTRLAPPTPPQLRREEVGIAAAQTLVAHMREEILSAEAERSRVLALKTDLARYCNVFRR